MPHYVVAMRGPAGFTFKRDQPLRVAARLEGGQPVGFTIHSIFPAPGGPEPAISREVWVDARGEADSLSTALEAFTNLARGLLAMISVTMNAPVGNVLAELGYDASEGTTEREFFQQFVPKHVARPTPARTVEVAHCVTVIGCLEHSVEKPRLERAIGQYHHAVQNWELGNETIALAHLWIAVEALTKAVLRRYLAANAISRDRLVEDWGIELRQLDAEVRRRLIFQGDDDTYRSAKKASDAYEHSFESPDAVRARASGTRERTAQLVREAIFRAMDLPEETFVLLTSAPLDRPYWMGTVAYAKGVLISESSELTKEGEVYPRLHWSHKSGASDDPDQPVQYHETIQPVLGPTVAFRPTRLELWGGPPEMETRRMNPQIVSGNDEDVSERSERPGCLGWLVSLGRNGTAAS